MIRSLGFRSYLTRASPGSLSLHLRTMTTSAIMCNKFPFSPFFQPSLTALPLSVHNFS
uniref:Uncharacterized protein n=1 Tax=Amphimedon queenslandica TaxID=400682 RepID=A0A1X7USJ2_AMPQE